MSFMGTSIVSVADHSVLPGTTSLLNSIVIHLVHWGLFIFTRPTALSMQTPIHHTGKSTHLHSLTRAHTCTQVCRHTHAGRRAHVAYTHWHWKARTHNNNYNNNNNHTHTPWSFAYAYSYIRKNMFPLKTDSNLPLYAFPLNIISVISCNPFTMFYCFLISIYCTLILLIRFAIKEAYSWTHNSVVMWLN